MQAQSAEKGKGKGKSVHGDGYVEALDGEEITQYSRCTIILDEESAGKGGHGIVSMPIPPSLCVTA